MTLSSTISTIYEFFASGYQSLIDWPPTIGHERAASELVLAEAPWRHRHRLSSAEYPTAPVLPRYQY